MSLNIRRTFTKRKLRRMGERVGALNRLTMFETRLYTFSYRSRGTNPYKPRQSNDKQPVLLIAYTRKRRKFFSVPGKRFSYVYGFNLNYLNGKRALAVLKELRDTFDDFNGEPITYAQLRATLDLPTDKAVGIFRKYRTGGGNLSGLVAINLDTYIEELDATVKRSSPIAK